MKPHHEIFADLFKRFVSSAILHGTYAESMYKKFVYLPGHQLELNDQTIVLMYKIDPDITNFHKGVHGGALATIIDASTTLALFKINQAKTVSVELSMSFLNPGKIGENILIKAESLKFGKTLCYSQAEIYNQDLRLLTTGRHVKAVVSGTFL